MLTNIKNVLMVDLEQIQSVEASTTYHECKLTDELQKITITYKTNMPHSVYEGENAELIAEYFLNYGKEDNA